MAAYKAKLHISRDIKINTVFTYFITDSCLFLRDGRSLYAISPSLWKNLLGK